MESGEEDGVETGVDNAGKTPRITPRFQRTTRERFDALGLWGLPQEFRDARTPASWWAADRERLLAVVHTGSKKWDVRVTLLMRDALNRYRPVRHSPALPTVRYAEDAISGPMGTDALAATFDHTTSGPPAGVDLFAERVPQERTAPEFRYLRDGVNQSAARDLLRALQPWVVDLDGNLVKDFQSTGYSARIWEIYLRFAFAEMNLEIASDHHVPDFELLRGDQRVFVEATTVNASGGGPGAGLRRGAPPTRPDDLMKHLEETMPLRFGSPLHTKMSKRYWDQPHVKGHPLVFAIADFHDSASMTWSHSALPIYLYGRSAELVTGPDGEPVGVEKFLSGFERKTEVLKPFFEQDGTENVSAILSSNAGTISKFNRMGARAGFGDRHVSLYRYGARHVPGPDAYEPLPFAKDVEAGMSEEGWSDELAMFHNPRAIVRVDEAVFPGIAHYHMVDGEAVWFGPPGRILYSSTMTVDRLGREKAMKGLWPSDTSDQENDEEGP